MGTRALPDMYALSPRACGPWASGIHIRQSTRAHVITYVYLLLNKNTPGVKKSEAKSEAPVSIHACD